MGQRDPAVSHERITGVGTDQGEINVYGAGTPQAGKPITPIYGFERDVYPTPEAATQAAVLRSMLFGIPGQRVSTSDYLRTNPTPDVLQALMILYQLRGAP